MAGVLLAGCGRTARQQTPLSIAEARGSDAVKALVRAAAPARE